MSLESAKPQMSGQLELPLWPRGEAPKPLPSEEAPTATNELARSGASDLMVRVLERRNLQAALKRVRKNKGSPGIDGMTVDELPKYLRAHWHELREQLLAGAYQPSPVRRQLIPKGTGGVRELGIPTVLDRFIQQALLQVLQPIFDPSSPSTAMASGQDGGLTMQFVRHKVLCRKADGGWWTSISRNSSIASTMMC